MKILWLWYFVCLLISFVCAYFHSRFYGYWFYELLGFLSLMTFLAAVVTATELFASEFLTGATLILGVLGIVGCLYWGDCSAKAFQARGNNLGGATCCSH